MVFREGQQFTALKAADEKILNEHFYRDVIVESTHTKNQSETSHQMKKQTTECQIVEPLGDDPPPDPPKLKRMSRELAALDMSLGDAWKLPAEVSHRNRTVGDRLSMSAQLALQDEIFKDMIPIYTAAAISNDHEDGIDDPKSSIAATDPPLMDKWDTAMKGELDSIGQHQVVGDFMEIPEWRKALPSHSVYKIKRDGVGNVQWIKATLVCGGNHQIERIDYQDTYSPTALLGHVRLALAITAKYNLRIHQLNICTTFLGVALEEAIDMHPPQ